MKADISNQSHDASARYSGIYQQQGRMLTDADWGELMALINHRLDDALVDVIGGGAPRGEPQPDATSSFDPATETDRRGVRLVEDGGAILVEGTHLYAEGVRAVVAGDPPNDRFGIDQQADFPGASVPPSDRPVVIYADVWDRELTAVEDPTLLDAGLHGADTCFRTRTMAQIKWAAHEDASIAEPPDVTDVAVNPPMGDARLTVERLESSEAADACDPCARAIEIEDRVADGLFRVEIHRVDGPPNDPTEIEILWSSENGAEHAAYTDEVPPEFFRGVVEFTDEVASIGRGVHLAPGFTPTRGMLVDYDEAGLPATAPPDPSAAGDEPTHLVRRWDGRATFRRSGSTYELVEAIDEARTLDVGAGATVGSTAVLEFRRFKLTLELADRTFVAGDYWLAPVRARALIDTSIVVEDALPAGIRHRYAVLGSLDGGSLVTLGTADRRRLGFPPLSDLRAWDVGYTTSCASGLYGSEHDTVKAALDRLCELAAEHVGFVPPEPCSSGVYDALGPDSTVRDALEALCGLRAGHVEFTVPDSCDTDVFAGLGDDGSRVTVQDALERMCTISGGERGCCEVTVRADPSVDLGELLRKLAERSVDLAGEGVCLCLARGQHRLQSSLEGFFGPSSSVVIRGCDATATRLVLDEDLVIRSLAEDSDERGGGPIARFEMRSLALSTRGHLVRVEADRIRMDDVVIRHEAPDFRTGALSLRATDRIDLEDADVRSLLVGEDDAESEALEIEGHDEVGETVSEVARRLSPRSMVIALRETGLADLLLGTSSGEARLTAAASIARELEGSSAARSTLLRSLEPLIDALPSAKVRSRTGSVLPRSDKGVAEALRGLRKDLTDDLANLRTAIADRLELIGRSFAFQPATAVVIEDAAADVSITGCRLIGSLALYGPAFRSLHEVLRQPEADPDRLPPTKDVVGSSGRAIRVRGTSLSRLDLSEELVTRILDPGGRDAATLVFTEMVVDGCRLEDAPHRAIAIGSTWQGNLFERTTSDQRLGYVAGRAAVLVANRGWYGDGDGLRVFADDHEISANLLVPIRPG